MILYICALLMTLKSETPSIEPYLKIYQKQLVDQSMFPINDQVKYYIKVQSSYRFMGISIQELNLNFQGGYLGGFNISIAEVIEMIKTTSVYIQIDLYLQNLIMNLLSVTLVMSDEVEIRQVYLQNSDQMTLEEVRFRINFEEKMKRIPKVQIYLNGISFHGLSFELIILSVDPKGFEFTVIGLNVEIKYWLTVTFIAFDENNEDPRQMLITTEGALRDALVSNPSNLFSPVVDKFTELREFQADPNFQNSLILGINGANFSSKNLSFQVHYFKNTMNYVDVFVSGVLNETFVVQYLSIIRVSCPSQTISKVDTGQFECLAECINNMTTVFNMNNPYNQYTKVVKISTGPDKYCTCSKSQYLRDLRCYSCHYSCVTCSSINSCQICAKNRRQLNPKSLCECSPGYFEQNESCYMCDTHCKECLGPRSSNCTVCREGTLNIMDVLTSSGQCQCPPGLYYFNKTCLACHYTCSSCFGTTLFQCSSCQFTRKLSAKGTCDCEDGYFNLGKPIPEDFDLDSIIFPLGSPFKNPDFLAAMREQVRIQNLCYKCHKFCRRCIGIGLEDCTSCYHGMIVDVQDVKYQSGTCICPMMEYMTEDVLCRPCEIGCLRCIAREEGNCYKCMEGYTLEVASQVQMLLLGFCRCPNGEARNATSGDCRPCHRKCMTCDGLEINSCTSCDTDLHFKLELSRTCECDDGYYEANYFCLQCSPQCTTCQQEKYLCTGCGVNRLSFPDCLCNPGYYDDNGICAKCWMLCYKCYSSSPDSCQEGCHFGLILPKNATTGRCLCNNSDYQFSFITKRCERSLYFWTFNYFNPFNNRHYLNVYWSQEVFIKNNTEIYNPYEHYERLMNDGRISERALQQIEEGSSIEKVPRHFKGINESEESHVEALYPHFNDLKFKQVMNKWVKVNVSKLTGCQYRVQVLSQWRNLMVIEIEYFKAFSQSVVGVSFDEANELFTKNLTVLSSTQAFNFTIGPYHTVDSSMIGNPLYRSAAFSVEDVNTDHEKLYLKAIFVILRYTKIVQIALPSISACITLFQLSSNISVVQYNFLSILAYTQFPNITRYSYQAVPKLNVSGFQNAIHSFFNKKLMDVAVAQSPPNLQKMDYLGIFLYDLDVTLIILAILTTLRIVEFMYPTPRLPFFAYLHVRYVKATFYEICLALFIQNFHSLRTTEKSLVLTFSWVGSILIFLVYLTTIIISLRAVLSFDRIEYLIFEQVKDTDTIVKVMSLVPSMRRRMVYYQVPNYNYQSLSQVGDSKPRKSQYFNLEEEEEEDACLEEKQEDLVQADQNMLKLVSQFGLALISQFDFQSVFHNSSEKKPSSNYQFASKPEAILFANRPFLQGVHQVPQHNLVFKFIWLSKRLVVAILVAAAAPEHQQDVLSTFLVVQCLYIAYKVLFRPYLHWVTFTFKLIGDLFFAYAIYATIEQEVHLQELFMTHEFCEHQALAHDYGDWLHVTKKGWQACFALCGFIICYLIEAIIAPFLSQVEIQKVIKQVIPIVKEKKVEVPQPPLKVVEEQEKLEWERIKRRYKLFNYSELFNWGICMDNEMMAIRWWSQMVKSEQDEDSSGVRYRICIINKSSRYSMVLKDLKFRVLGGGAYERKEKESSAIEDKVLRPNSFKNFNEEVIMDFATLSAYDDFLQFGGRAELEGVHGAAPIEFDFKLCTSELKLLSNFKNFELDGGALGGGEEMGILFQKHLTYEDDSLAIVLTEFHFVSASSISDQHEQQEYLAKFRTNFHRYRPLEYFLEMTVRMIERKMRIRVMVSEVTRDLAMWSGYRQVLETWGKSLVNFLKQPQQWIDARE